MFTLQEKSKPEGVKYSPKEKALFKGVPKDGKRTTTTKLVRSVYRDRAPFHARTAVLVILRRLMHKIEFNNEPFRIARSDANGSQQIEVWLEPKQ